MKTTCAAWELGKSVQTFIIYKLAVQRQIAWNPLKGEIPAPSGSCLAQAFSTDTKRGKKTPLSFLINLLLYNTFNQEKEYQHALWEGKEEAKSEAESSGILVAVQTSSYLNQPEQVNPQLRSPRYARSPRDASGAVLQMRNGTVCVQTWLFLLEKKTQAKISREEKYLKDASGRKEADSVGQSRKVQRQGNTTHPLYIQNNNLLKINSSIPNFLVLLYPTNVPLPCIHY